MCYIQGDAMLGSRESLNLPDGWNFLSRLSIAAVQDDVSVSDPCRRISIGAFMLTRTEALGSLDGAKFSSTYGFSRVGGSLYYAHIHTHTHIFF